MKYCEKCDRVYSDEKVFCIGCGAKLSEVRENSESTDAKVEQIFCFKCGAENSIDSSFCCECGNKLIFEKLENRMPQKSITVVKPKKKRTAIKVIAVISLLFVIGIVVVIFAKSNKRSKEVELVKRAIKYTSDDHISSEMDFYSDGTYSKTSFDEYGKREWTNVYDQSGERIKTTEYVSPYIAESESFADSYCRIVYNADGTFCVRESDVCRYDGDNMSYLRCVYDSFIYECVFEDGILRKYTGIENSEYGGNDKICIDYDNTGKKEKIEIFNCYDDSLEASIEFNENGIRKTCIEYDNSPAGKTVKTSEYDEEGKIVKEIITYINGNSVYDEFEYDSENRQEKILHYDISGTLMRWDEFEYDCLGRETKHVEYNGDGTIRCTKDMVRDVLGNSGELITYYNTDGSVDYVDSEGVSIEYDNNGNYRKVVLRGIVLEYEYGMDDNITRMFEYFMEEDYENGNVTDYLEYRYDSKGNVIRIESEHEYIVFDYMNNQ